MKFKKVTKNIIIAISFCLFTSISASAITKEEAVQYFVENYPKARLTDLYKSFYQDNFGPGHLLEDSEKAKSYFLYELQDSSEWGGPDFEFTGEGNNFIRLNMDLVRKGIIPSEEYFQAFQNSLGRVAKPTDEYWITEWIEIDSLINSKGITFPNEVEDRIFIEEKLKNRNFPIHHSEDFNSNYNFHYRIISFPEFEKLKNKYLRIGKNNN